MFSTLSVRRTKCHSILSLLFFLLRYILPLGGRGASFFRRITSAEYLIRCATAEGEDQNSIAEQELKLLPLLTEERVLVPVDYWWSSRMVVVYKKNDDTVKSDFQT